MIDKSQVRQEQFERIRLGDIAKEGLNSSFWLEIVKPIIDSMLKGVIDITSVNITSEKKASIELAGRKLTAEYLKEIENLINGFVVDSETTKKVQAKSNEKPLYRTIEEE